MGHAGIFLWSVAPLIKIIFIRLMSSFQIDNTRSERNFLKKYAITDVVVIKAIKILVYDLTKC